MGLSGMAVATASTAAAPSAEPAVRLAGVCKHFRVRRPLSEVLRQPFGRHTLIALDHVNLTVAEGSLHALLGQNGAGKSTLFRILSTLLLPDAGTATVFGEDVVLDAREARTLVSAASADERSLNWRLSAVENLRLFTALHGLPAREARARVDEVLDIVGLRDSARLLAGQLSSGLRQRLLVARALLPRPRLLLLDEPTRSLDPLTARELRRFLRDELVGRLGMTILLATHDAEEALSFADRVSVLHRGRLVADGAPQVLASELGLERLRIVCRASDAAAATRVAARRGIPALPAAADAGWVSLDVPARHDADAEAELLGELTRAGVTVARLERIRPTLAELLQRAIADADSVARAPDERRIG